MGNRGRKKCQYMVVVIFIGVILGYNVVGTLVTRSVVIISVSNGNSSNENHENNDGNDD